MMHTKNTYFKPFSAIFIIVAILLLPLISAEILPHKLNTKLDVVISSNNATTCNVSYVLNPDGTKNYLNIIMSKNGNSYNRTLNGNNFTLQGTTCIGLVCSDGSGTEVGSICKDVTYTGDKINAEQTTVYIIGLGFLLLVMIGIILIIYTLPSVDAQDVEGNIIQISWLKYLRPILWGTVWAIGLACLFIVSNLGLAFLPNSMIGDLFFVLFRIMFYVTIILVPMYFIWIFYRIFRDAEFKRMIERGIDVKGNSIV